jgi:tRNA pseudouridine38-40 synthase
MVLKQTGPGLKPELNIKLIIEYDGKNYSGWQRQKNNSPCANSIQKTIEDSLQVLFKGTKIRLIGAGRTDSGVHALNQTANFKITQEAFSNGCPSGLNKLIHSLNALLPGDIAVKGASFVKDDFHSRYSAKKRLYKYLISTGKKAYNADKYFRLKTKFDIDLAKEYCKLIEGTHSFKPMCKNKDDKHNFMSHVYYARTKKVNDDAYEFEICANRFLHSMVRAIVGMMVKVASGKISIKEFKNKFEKGEPLKIQYAPSNALILYKITY